MIPRMTFRDPVWGNIQKLRKEVNLMERPLETVKRYERADSYERLCLFLQFPNLRDEFLDVDSKAPVTKMTTLSRTDRIHLCS